MKNDKLAVYNNLMPGTKEEFLEKERNQKVVRSVRLIQEAQYTLTLQEMRFLQYTISKVKTSDAPDKEYSIELRDYLDVCGLKKSESYAAMREMITNIYKSMVLGYEDADTKEYVITNWFDHCTVAPNSGTVKFQFSSKVSRFLTLLAEYNENSSKSGKIYYISEKLRNSLPYKSRYTHYLYPELLARQNRREWTFPLEELRERLDVFERPDDPASALKDRKKKKRHPLYSRFTDFKRNVLDVAVADINRFSPTKCVYEVIRRGKVVQYVKFYYEEKTPDEEWETENRCDKALGSTRVLVPVTDYEVPVVFYEAYPPADTFPPSRIATDEEREWLTRPKNAKYFKEKIDRSIKKTQAVMATEEATQFERELIGKRKPRKPRFESVDIDISNYFHYVDAPEGKWVFESKVNGVNDYIHEVSGEMLVALSNERYFQGWFFEDLFKKAIDYPNPKIITRKNIIINAINDKGITLESDAEKFRVVIHGSKSVKSYFDVGFRSIFGYRHRAIDAYKYFKGNS